MAHVLGHAIPGMVFVFFGLTWIVHSFWLHLTTANGSSSSNRDGKGRKSTGYSDFKREARLSRLSYIPQPYCTKIPMESLVKIAVSMLGIIAEAFTGEGKHKGLVFKVEQLYASDGSLKSVSTIHHMTMYGAMMMSGIVDLIGVFVRLPRNMTKIFFSMAFFVNGVLFWFQSHQKHRHELDVAVHTLLFVAIVPTVILSLLRMLQPANVLINSFLGISLLIQGTWFINMADIVYSNNSIWTRGEEYQQIMFAVAIFNWHVIGDSFFALLMYVLMSVCVKYKKQRRDGSKTVWPSLPFRKGDIPDEEEMKLMPL